MTELQSKRAALKVSAIQSVSEAKAGRSRSAAVALAAAERAHDAGNWSLARAMRRYAYSLLKG